MLERLLVEQRLGIARAQQAQVVPVHRDHLLDQVVHGSGCIHGIARTDSRVTSVDVARHAGVSQSTVSLVLSGKSAGRISARTEAAVRSAAEELGYRPNVAARDAAHRHGAHDRHRRHRRDAPVLRAGAARRPGAAWRAGYAVALVDVANDPDHELESFEALRAGPADGFLFFTIDPPVSDRASRSWRSRSRRRACRPCASTPSTGPSLAVRHLIELGHTRIGHLGSTLVRRDVPDAARDTCCALLAEAGLEPGALRAGGRSASTTPHDAGLALLDAPERPTAIYCDDDLLAGGIYLAARELGLRIPEDVSVVGFDDLPFAKVFEPPLTTIRDRARGARQGGLRGACRAHGRRGARGPDPPRALRRARVHGPAGLSRPPCEGRATTP